MEESVKEFVDEVREDFQIPPYASDDSIARYYDEGLAYFESLSPGCSEYVGLDKTLRSLLKNYVYYAYVHALNDFIQNYKSAILTWQINMVVHDD